MQVESYPVGHLQQVSLPPHGSPFHPAWPWVPLVQPQHHVCSVCLGGAIKETLQVPSPLGFSLQINNFSVLPPFFPCCLIISHCRVRLLLSELPATGTKKPREALLRNQARSHRDICRGKCSPYQQTARMQIHKQTQINRLTPPSKPETHPHRQML